MAPRGRERKVTCAGFDAYEAEVKRYGWSWFRTNTAAIAVIKAVPAVRAQAYRLSAALQTVGTDIIYRAGDRWVDERIDVQKHLIDEALRMGGLTETADIDDADPVPQAILLLGLPGSGKSSTLRPIADELVRRTSERSQVVVDADIVRSLFPEYAAGLGSEVVQIETSDVANRSLIDAAFERRAHIVLDKVGHPERTIAVARYLDRTGWSVWCLCASIDVDVEVERAQRRAAESGRYVPPKFIRSVGSEPLEAYEALRDSHIAISGCALLDTDVELGTPPIVLDAYSEDLFGHPGDVVSVWPSGEE